MPYYTKDPKILKDKKDYAEPTRGQPRAIHQASKVSVKALIGNSPIVMVIDHFGQLLGWR